MMSLELAEWVKDIMDGSSSLKAFLALAGESISERESKRFEEGLNTKVKLTLYKTFGKAIEFICMGWLMQDPDCLGQEPMG